MRTHWGKGFAVNLHADAGTDHLLEAHDRGVSQSNDATAADKKPASRTASRDDWTDAPDRALRLNRWLTDRRIGHPH
ncbi:MAG: hypothetical protein MUE46_00385 [Xanthomonadales bacterium]|nr:hypothetical protein [Xanthomonadales bacterium]